MRRLTIALSVLTGCTVLTSPGDYEGGDGDGGARLCMDDDECPDGVCNTARGECIDCRVATDCGDGEECDGGLCVPADCGGVVCPETMPICLVNETEEICVECALAGDCAAGETCTASFVCEACMPTAACEADEVCIADGGGDFCLDCDVDGDGRIRRDARCAGVVGERDCDDDDDGYCALGGECLGACAELAGDCDDGDDEVVPELIGCGDSAMGCGDPGSALAGAGVGSLSVLELASLPAPQDPRLRPPNSVIVQSPDATGTFDVLFLSEGAGGSYESRSRLVVDADGRSAPVGSLPTTTLQDFLDLRVKVDPAGTLVAALGTSSGSLIRSAEVVVADSLDGSPSGAPLVFQDPAALAPVDASVESDLSVPTPYAVWCSESTAGECDLRFGVPGMTFADFMNAGSGDATIVRTSRGLAVAGSRSDSDLIAYDPRAGLEGDETRDAGGAFALANAEGTLGFDLRFIGGELVARGLTFTTSGYSASEPESVAGADVDSRVGLFALLDYGYLAFDAPIDGSRRILLGSLSDGSGSPQVSELLELTGGLTPDFSTVYGVEVAARDNTDAEEVAVLVHGTLEGADAPALYLFVARRCAP